MMRPIIGALATAGLVLGLGAGAGAQTSPGAFGGPGVGVAAGSNRGDNPGVNPAGLARPANQPYVYYAANNVVPRTGPFAYKPTYSYRPGVTNYYSYGAGNNTPGVIPPVTSYSTPGTVTYGTFQTPNTVSSGPLTPGGYGTYINPSYRGYVMPQGNFVRYYVR